MILLGYDGSPDAQAAVDRAAELFPGGATTVLTLWEPLVNLMVRSGGSMGAGFADSASIDLSSERTALDHATEGANRANAAGLVATPRTATIRVGEARAILDAAQTLGAAVIVLGTRGRGGIKSLLLGSVSHEVVQHADRPVLVVPSAEVSAERREWSERTVELAR